LVDVFGFVPDFVVADGGKGIRPAVEVLARRTGHDIVSVTSHFHIKQQIGRAIDKARRAKTAFDPGSLAGDVDHDRMLTSRDAWQGWWKAYERRLKAQGVPRSGSRPSRSVTCTTSSAGTWTPSRRSRTYPAPRATWRTC
jgi:hypothetical protein